MIGNVYPVEDSGWSVLEVGELDRASFSLQVQGYQISNRAGDSVGNLFSTLNAAVEAAKGLACSENGQSSA
jgi:hypothetical protein